MIRKSDKKIIIPINANSIVEFLKLVGDELVWKGFKIKYIPQDNHIYKTAKKKLLEKRIHSDYLNHNPNSDLEILCEKYEIDSPRNLVFPEMVYDRSYDSPSYRSYWFSGTGSRPNKEYLNLLHRTLDYLDQLYERDDGGIPLQYQGGEVLRRVLQRVADYHGYPSVRISFSPVPGHSLFRSTEEMRLPALQAASYDDMTAEQRDTAREFRDSVTENQHQVMEYSDESESLYQNLRRKVRRIQEHRADLTPVISNWLRRRVAKPVVGAAAKHLYLDEMQSRQFIESNKYVFYPLQYARESRVTMRAPEFYNQLWLIEYLSRSLPPGYELVVKDHPQQLGALPISHAYKLRRYATAVDPTMSARKVLTEADAIVTLNNTVGYEAVMYGKSVVALGDAFHSGAGYTRDVSGFDSLPVILNDAVDSDNLSDEVVIEFAHGLLESSYQGEWGRTNKENISAFSDSIVDFTQNKAQDGHK